VGRIFDLRDSNAIADDAVVKESAPFHTAYKTVLFDGSDTFEIPVGNEELRLWAHDC